MEHGIMILNIRPKICPVCLLLWILGIFILPSISFSIERNVTIHRSDESNTTVFIMVRDIAEVKGEKIFLKDLAVIEAEIGLLKKLEGIEIGLSPKPGREKIVSGRWILSQIQSRRFLPKSVKADIPDTVFVKRLHQEVSEETLLDVLNDFLVSEMPDADFKVNHIKIRGENIFPSGRIRLRIDDSYRMRRGRCVNLPVWVEVDEKRCDKIIISGIVDIYKTVLCVNSYVKRGTILSAGDLFQKEVNITKAPQDILYDQNDAVGKLVKSNIREGAFIRDSMLEVPPLIEKGDKVKLVAGRGALSVVTMGIAQTNGFLGGQINIENINSKKTIVGRVRDASTVEVIF